MAKRSVLDHPKFTELQETLKQPKGAVLGWLECLWHFTAKFTPQGNIGKYTDKQIERWLEWDGEPGELISSLITCGWLDKSDAYRVVVHDWHDHCDDSVKKTLKRNGIECVSGHVQTKPGQITDSSRLPVPSQALPEPGPGPQSPPPVTAAPSFQNPIERFSVPVQNAAREAMNLWHEWAKGGSPDPDSEATKADLNRLASAEEGKLGTVVTTIRRHIATPPPGFTRDTPLWKILKHNGYDAPVSSHPARASPPKAAYKDYTAERLAKEKAVT